MRKSEQWLKWSIEDDEERLISETDFIYIRDTLRTKIGVVVRIGDKYGWSLYNYFKEQKQPDLIFGLKIAIQRATHIGYDALEDIEKRINKAALYRLTPRLARTRSVITMFKSRRAEK